MGVGQCLLLTMQKGTSRYGILGILQCRYDISLVIVSFESETTAVQQHEVSSYYCRIQI